MICVFNFVQFGEIKDIPELVQAGRQDALEQEPASVVISTQWMQSMPEAGWEGKASDSLCAIIKGHRPGTQGG